MGKVKRFRPAPPSVARSLLRLAQAPLTPTSSAGDPPKTMAHAIALALFRKALKGDAAAAKEILDRTEGPAVCPKCGQVNEP